MPNKICMKSVKSKAINKATGIVTPIIKSKITSSLNFLPLFCLSLSIRSFIYPTFDLILMTITNIRSYFAKRCRSIFKIRKFEVEVRKIQKGMKKYHSLSMGVLALPPATLQIYKISNNPRCTKFETSCLTKSIQTFKSSRASR